ncbi:hypothetical protein BC829DRAFT_112525 [Chytridium lagenaria]|nr:hypothetical protein BC829DRAFT_112525 [Chytridium lagenaria]
MKTRHHSLFGNKMRDAILHHPQLFRNNHHIPRRIHQPKQRKHLHRKRYTLPANFLHHLPINHIVTSRSFHEKQKAV